MKIEIHKIEETSIEDFAEKHDLIMVVNERARPSEDAVRYYASFKSSEIQLGYAGLIGTYGDGSSPEEAIANYAKEISLKTLVIDAMRDSRREIDVPRLILKNH